MSFSVLLDAAVAGTLRRDAPAAVPGSSTLEPADRLLRGASYEGLRRLAGRPLDRVEDVVAVEPCAPETLPVVSRLAELRLLDILVDRPAMLLEWLGLAAAGKLRVPHASLPDILEHARTHPEVHELVLQVGGERLFWLARLNPDWQFAARADPEERLALGTRSERPSALRQIRRRSAARGREVLMALWPAERGESRAALLDVLGEGLSADDEPLLEQAVQDPRKEVRETGLRWIRRIANSRFSQRWIERARQLVVLGSSRIDVREPGEPDPTWVADGLDPRPPKGIGQTAWLLQQTLAFTPPSIWPRGTIAVLEHSDWSQPLVSGLSQAAQAYADADWCEDFLIAWVGATRTPLHPGGLLAALAPDRAEAVFSRLAESANPGVAALAASMTHPWSEDFSRLMVARLPALLEKWQYAAGPFLRDAPLRLDPRVFTQAAHLLTVDIEPAWARPALQRLIQTLEFRHALRLELEP